MVHSILNINHIKENLPKRNLVNKDLSLPTILVQACVYKGGIPAPSNNTSMLNDKSKLEK